MRIRSTKPEFWRSRTIASVDWDSRLVLKGLESYVDDNGVGKDDIELIVSDLFPRDLAREHSRTLARVTEALSHLYEAGLIWRYEHEGVKLLYVSNWDSIQRVDKPQKGRLCRPDGTWDYKESIIREHSRGLASPPETVAPVTGEQGNRGTGEQAATRKRAAHPLPETWKPNAKHAEQALAKGLDVHSLATRFRNWAEASDKRYVSWDATFRNWIDRENPRPTQQPPTKSLWDLP